MADVLVVDDNSEFANSHANLLRELGYSVSIQTSSTAALDFIKRDDSTKLILLDMMMPEMDGIELLRRVKSIKPHLGVIVATVVSDVEKAVHATRHGAFNYLLKPLNKSALRSVVENYFSSKHALNQGQLLNADFFSCSPLIEEMFQDLKRLALEAEPFILVGEPGTGKNKIAELFHSLSNDSKESLFHFDVRGVPDYLLETKLFGNATPNTTDRPSETKGILQVSKNTTLVISGFSFLSSQLQKSIFHVLKTRSFFPLGASTPEPLQCRIVLSITHNSPSDPNEEEIMRWIKELNLEVIQVPPLRLRGAKDVELLAKYFLAKYSSQYAKVISQFSDEALQALLSYDYPGNISELEKIIRLACLVEESTILQSSSLPRYVFYQQEENSFNLEDVKFRTILRALHDADHNQTIAAKRLGIARGTLNRLLQQYKREGRNIG